MRSDAAKVNSTYKTVLEHSLEAEKKSLFFRKLKGINENGYSTEGRPWMGF